MSESRNWADLPGELSHLISKKLPTDCIYLLSFRAVCKNWRTSASLSDLQPQLPWLIEREKPDEMSVLGPNLRFCTLAGGDTGTIGVPEPYRGMVYYGPGHGYLFVSSLEDDLNLLNLLTGDLISLPYTSKNSYFGHSSMQSAFCSGSNPVHNWHVVSHCIKDSPVRPQKYVIYHANENDWKSVDIAFCNIAIKTCCWDGKLFAIADIGTWVFDAVSGKGLYHVGPPADELDEDSRVLTRYVVKSCGEILNITWYLGSDKTEEFGVAKFGIYKLYSEGERHSWVKVSYIGDQIVFLDLINGFSMRAPAGTEGNCIYFLLDDGSTPCKYDIDTERVERLPCPFKNCTWFIPNLG